MEVIKDTNLKNTKVEQIESVINGQAVQIEFTVPVPKVRTKVEKPVKEKVDIKLNNEQVNAVLLVIDLIISKLNLNMSTEGYVVQFRTDDESFKNRLKKINKLKKMIEYKNQTGLELSEETIDSVGFETYQMSSNPGFTIISFSSKTLIVSDHFTRGEAASNVIYFGDAFVDGKVDQDFIDNVSQYLQLINRRNVPGDYAWKK